MEAIMRVKLPINYDPIIKYECWTFFRTSIISAYPELEDWFVNHLNDICITSQYDCDFGTNGRKYNIVSHYEQALEFVELTFSSFNEKNIIEKLSGYLNDGLYVIIDIDSSKIYTDIEESFVAQFLIYGYDDEKQVFFSPSIYDGYWHEIEIKWCDFIKAFNVRKSFDKDKILTTTSRQNPFPILLIKPRKDIDQNILLSCFYNEMRDTLQQSHEIYQRKNEGLSFRQGVLGVYEGLAEMLLKIYNKALTLEELGYDHSLHTGFFKVYEFVKMFSKRLEAVDKSFDLGIPEKIHRKIQNLIQSSEVNKNLVLKYLTESDDGILLRISEHLHHDKTILESIYKELLQTILERFAEE